MRRFTLLLTAAAMLAALLPAGARKAARAAKARRARHGRGDDRGHGKGNANGKLAARAAIEEQGYRIIANIGDQYSDLAGGHADRAFKVPNPFSFLP